MSGLIDMSDVPADLRPFVVMMHGGWEPHFGMQPYLYLSWSSRPSEDQLQAAVAAGMGVYLSDLSESDGTLSLHVLDAVIQNLTQLIVGAATPIVDLHVLESAANLAYLRWDSSPSKESVDLSLLPRLVFFNGPGASVFHSAWANPSLETLWLDDVDRRGAPAIGPRVRDLLISGDPSRPQIAPLQNPEGLLALRREFCRGFDAAQLREMPGLQSLSLARCADMRNIATIGELTDLTALRIDDCTTTEPWEWILDTSLTEVRITSRPFPSRRLCAAGRERGWTISAGPEGDARFPPFVILPPERRGAAYAVILDRFTELDEAGAGSAETVNGYLAERMLRDVIERTGVPTPVGYDSESDCMVVLMRNKSDAVALAKDAALLWHDPSALAHAISRL